MIIAVTSAVSFTEFPTTPTSPVYLLHVFITISFYLFITAGRLRSDNMSPHSWGSTTIPLYSDSAPLYVYASCTGAPVLRTGI